MYLVYKAKEMDHLQCQKKIVWYPRNKEEQITLSKDDSKRQRSSLNSSRNLPHITKLMYRLPWCFWLYIYLAEDFRTSSISKEGPLTVRGWAISLAKLQCSSGGIPTVSYLHQREEEALHFMSADILHWTMRGVQDSYSDKWWCEQNGRLMEQVMINK